MRTMALNIEGVRRSKHAARLLKREEPDLAGFLQAYRARLWLAQLAVRRGYYRHHARGQQEFQNICVFIKKDPELEVLSVTLMVMEEGWVGGKAGRHHEPRVYVKVVARKRGQRITRTVFVHLPTDNSTKAQEESKDRLVAYRRRHAADDVAFVGDFNEDDGEVLSLVRRLGGRLRSTGKVDHGIFCEGTGRDGTELMSSAKSLRRWMQPGAHGWGIYSYWRARINRKGTR